MTTYCFCRHTLITSFLLSLSLFCSLEAREYSIKDGDNLSLTYSVHGATLIKLHGSQIKQILDGGQFEKFITDNRRSLFLTNINHPQAFFLVLDDE